MSHSLPLPKYHQIYLVLREQLHEGRFSQGMPGELALMRQFGVARVTIRRALSQLVDEGLITREPGRGTRPLTPADVTGSPGPGQRAQLSGLLENIISMGLRTSVKVLSVDELDPPGEVALRLDLPSGERVQKAVRVRSTREGPLSYITTWVPQRVARSFGRHELSRKPILVLMEEAGVRVGRAEQSISARLADAELAHKARAVPAGRQGGREGHRGVAALAARVAECTRFAVHRGVTVLYAQVVSAAQQSMVFVEPCGADGDSALGRTGNGLGYGNLHLFFVGDEYLTDCVVHSRGLPCVWCYFFSALNSTA